MQQMLRAAEGLPRRGVADHTRYAAEWRIEHATSPMTLRGSGSARITFRRHALIDRNDTTMFRVSREIDFCYGHRLLNYQGKCRYLHGHNGRAVITLQGTELDPRGMLVDFGDIKRKIQHWIDENLDHNMLLCRDDPLLPVLPRGGRARVRDGRESHRGEHRPPDLREDAGSRLAGPRGRPLGDARTAAPPFGDAREPELLPRPSRSARDPPHAHSATGPINARLPWPSSTGLSGKCGRAEACTDR